MKIRVMILTLGAALSVTAGTSVWTGAENGFWTNAANWAEGRIPGIIQTSDGGTLGETGDIALFSGPSDQTTLDLSGTLSIGKLVFTGADTPQYQIGFSKSQKLMLENDGRIVAEASLASPPILLATLQIGSLYGANSRVYIDNDAPEPLQMNNFFWRSEGAWHARCLRLSGTGGFRSYGTGSMGSSSLDFELNGTGPLEIVETLTIRELKTIAPGACRRVYIHEGKIFSIRNAGWTCCVIDEDLSVGGPGTFRVSSGSGTSGLWWNAVESVAAGKTLTIQSKLSIDGTALGTSHPGFRLGSGTGTVVFDGCVNEMPGAVEVSCSGTAVSSVIGMKGDATSPLGPGSEFWLSGGGRFLYTGPGETTDRDISLTNGVGIIDQGGTGELVFGPEALVKKRGTNGTLVLRNNGDVTGIFEATYDTSAQPLAVVKDGSGLWQYRTASELVGSMSVEGGTLEVSGPASLSRATVTVVDGVLKILDTADENDSARLGTVVLKGGSLVFEANECTVTESVALTMDCLSAQVNVGTGVALTLTSLQSGSNNLLDIIIASDASVILAGASEGSAPVWLTVNGRPAKIGPGGVLSAYSDVMDVEIPARGGVVPDGDASQRIGITTDGAASDGPITLASRAVTVNVLRQQTAADATVELDGGTLAASCLTRDAGTGAFTIGTPDGGGTLAAKDGILIFENADTAADLTVSSAVSFVSGGSFMKKGVGAVRLANGLTGTGSLVLSDGAFSLGTMDGFSATVMGSGALVKDGADTWNVPGAQPNFTGELILRGGVTTFAKPADLFGETSVLVITNGATLDLNARKTASLNSSDSFGMKRFRISGDGVDGRGAIVSSQDGDAYAFWSLMRYLTLDDDAVIGSSGTARWCFFGNSKDPSVFDMKGHTLYKKGPGSLIFGYGAITNVGPIYVEGSPERNLNAGIGVQGAFDLGGPDAPPITMGERAYFIFSGSSPQVRPMIIASSNVSMTVWSDGLSTNVNVWTGPITFADEKSMLSLSAWQNDGNRQITLAGPISGPGSLRFVGQCGRIALTCPTNDYTGKTEFSGSSSALIAGMPGSIPDYSKTSVNNGRIIAPYTDGVSVWTESDIFSFLNQATFLESGVLALDLTNAPDNAHTLNLDGRLTTAGVAGIGVDGPGTLTLTGVNTNVLTLGAWGGGRLNLSAGTFNIGRVDLSSDRARTPAGELVIDGGADVHTGDLDIEVGRISLCSGRMRVGDAHITSDLPGQGVYSRSICIGSSGSGVLEIEPGAVVSNKLRSGLYKGSSGFIFQRGGEWVNWCGAANDAVLGYYGYSYYELSGGLYHQTGYAQNAADVSGVGVFAQTGGEMLQTDDLGGRWGIARSGTGVVWQAGGVMNIRAPLHFCENAGANAFAAFTLASPASRVNVEGGILMNARTNALAVLNINGGLLTASSVARPSTAPNLPNSAAYVNFDGGTLATTADGTLFGAGSTAIDRVSVLKGGARIDVSNAVTRVSVPLEGPSGQGVIAVPWSDTGAYGGSPVVLISGDGAGATAYAVFEAAPGCVTGRVSRICVTSPGWGYTHATATVTRGGRTDVLTIPCELGVVAGGGFTKGGSGVLELSGTNTWEGDLTILGGVLRTASDGAIPSGRSLAMNGGELHLDGQAIDFSEINVTSGAIRGGSVHAGRIIKTGDGVFTLSSAVTADIVRVEGGTFEPSKSSPGMYERFVRDTHSIEETLGKSDTVSPLLRLTADYANDPSVWFEDINGTRTQITYAGCVYEGYIWNNGPEAVWSFIKNFDDAGQIEIDGQVVLTHATWDKLGKADWLMTPGPHAFRLCGQQYSGGAGPVGLTVTTPMWTDRTMGFAVDTQGRGSDNPADYRPFEDPGDGSFITTEAVNKANNSFFGELSFLPGTVMDLSGAAFSLARLSGTGLITNGTLTVTEAWNVDLAEVTQSGALPVYDAALVFAPNAVINVANGDLLDDRNARYVLAAANRDGAFDGPLPTLAGEDLRRAYLKKTSDGRRLELLYRGALIFMIQ